MKANIKVLVFDGVSGEVELDALMTASEAQTVIDARLFNPRRTIVTIRQNDSGDIVGQVTNGESIRVPVCRADYPAYTVGITI